MAKKRYSIFNKGAGPLISVVLHIGLIMFLVKVLVFRTPEKEEVIDVRVIEEPVREPNEEADRREDVQEPEAADAVETAEEPMVDLPEDTLLQESLIDPELDLSGLDSVADVESPLVMKGLMVGRTEAGRRKLLRLRVSAATCGSPTLMSSRNRHPRPCWSSTSSISCVI